jgi:DtxR family Mn-dependent transcriptional regulator
MARSTNRTTKLTASMEDYLEAIAIVKKRQSVARVRDVTKLLQVEAPSVTSALASLSKKGYVIHERYGYIDLTAKGERAARDVIKRHGVLFDFLTQILGVRSETAMRDACGMEHSLSGETRQRLAKLVELAQRCPDAEAPEWLRRFEHYCKTGRLGRVTRRKAHK